VLCDDEPQHNALPAQLRPRDHTARRAGRSAVDDTETLWGPLTSSPMPANVIVAAIDGRQRIPAS
jgi:hypothetical protein